MTKKFIYISRKGYYRPDYPYRIAIAEKGKELIIHHQAIINNKWTTTHSIGIKRKDLEKIIRRALERKE